MSLVERDRHIHVIKEAQGSKNSKVHQQSQKQDESTLDVLVAGFPNNTLISKAQEFLESICQGNRFSIIKRSKSKFRGYAFIHFQFIEDAEKFIQKEHTFNEKQLDTRIVKKFEDHHSAALNSLKRPTKVFCGDIPKSFTKKQVSEIFSKVGEVENFVYNEKKSSEKLIIVTNFKSWEDAKKCVEEKTLQINNILTVNVSYAKPKFSSLLMFMMHPTLRKHIDDVRKQIKPYNPKDFEELSDAYFTNTNEYLDSPLYQDEVANQKKRRLKNDNIKFKVNNNNFKKIEDFKESIQNSATKVKNQNVLFINKKSEQKIDDDIRDSRMTFQNGYDNDQLGYCNLQYTDYYQPNYDHYYAYDTTNYKENYQNVDRSFVNDSAYGYENSYDNVTPDKCYPGEDYYNGYYNDNRYNYQYDYNMADRLDYDSKDRYGENYYNSQDSNNMYNYTATYDEDLSDCYKRSRSYFSHLSTSNTPVKSGDKDNSQHFDFSNEKNPEALSNTLIEQIKDNSNNFIKNEDGSPKSFERNQNTYDQGPDNNCFDNYDRYYNQNPYAHKSLNFNDYGDKIFDTDSKDEKTGLECYARNHQNQNLEMAYDYTQITPTLKENGSSLPQAFRDQQQGYNKVTTEKGCYTLDL